MNEPIEPLVDRADDLLGALVARAREHDVEYDLDAGLARHLARVEALPALPWWRRALGGWRGGVALVVVAAAAVGVVAARREPVADEPAVVASVAAPADELPPARVEIVVTPVTVAVAAAPEPVPTVVHATAPRRAAAPREDDALAREAAQIRRARQKLERGDAEGALAICRAGAREFPAGTFVQERAGIRVLALHALGRPDAAGARDYLARWPDGTLAPRIRATLAAAE